MKRVSKIPEGNPFKVPENYFETVTSKIISATSGTTTGGKKKVLDLRIRTFLAVAASVAILCLLSYTGLLLFSPRNSYLSFSEISVETYSESIIYDLDINTLEQDPGLSGIPEDKEQIEKTDIIDYLLLEEIDIFEIQELI